MLIFSTVHTCEWYVPRSQPYFGKIFYWGTYFPSAWISGPDPVDPYIDFFANGPKSLLKCQAQVSIYDDGFNAEGTDA